MAFMAKNIILPYSVADVEAKAAVRALRFAQELNFSSIILEGDSEVIIKVLCSEDESFASYGHLIAEAKVLTDSFSCVRFSHIRRQGNSIAHNLTRYVSGFLVWMEDVPSHINNVLLANFG